MSSLRRYDVQATFAFVLGVISVAPLAVAVWLTLRNYQSELGQILYGSRSYLLVHHGSLVGAMVPSFLAILLGWNSAGQRRNEKQSSSWIGFFVGGTVLTVAIIVLIGFYMLRLEHAPAPVTT